MQYCLQNLDKHRFGDVSPASVESDYARYGARSAKVTNTAPQPLTHHVTPHVLYRLAERLGQHSQTHKQKALAVLVNLLVKCEVESKQLEPHHKVLSVLYWLAQRPLESPWAPEDEDDDAHSGMVCLTPYLSIFCSLCSCS